MEGIYRAVSFSEPLQPAHCVRQTILSPDSLSSWKRVLWVISTPASLLSVAGRLAQQETFSWFGFHTGLSVQLETAFATTPSLHSPSKMLSHSILMVLHTNQLVWWCHYGWWCASVHSLCLSKTRCVRSPSAAIPPICTQGCSTEEMLCLSGTVSALLLLFKLYVHRNK